MASNGPTVLILPKDIQDEEYEEPAVAHGFTRSGVGYNKPKIVPEDADLAKAAEILNAGSKVAILSVQVRAERPATDRDSHPTSGRRREGAAEKRRVARRPALRHRRDRATGHRAELDLMQGCDTLLMVGMGFPWSEFLPKDGGARAVQIDIDASMLSLRYPVDLHGDASDTLKALLPLIRRTDGRE